MQNWPVIFSWVKYSQLKFFAIFLESRIETACMEYNNMCDNKMQIFNGCQHYCLHPVVCILASRWATPLHFLLSINFYKSLTMNENYANKTHTKLIKVNPVVTLGTTFKCLFNRGVRRWEVKNAVYMYQWLGQQITCSVCLWEVSAYRRCLLVEDWLAVKTSTIDRSYWERFFITSMPHTIKFRY